MGDVLQRVAALRANCTRHQTELSQRFTVPLGDPPIGGFGICHNTATVTLELLSFYNDLWGKLDPRSVPDIARARQENAERVMVITKALYIMALSGFEFAAKNALALRPKKLAIGGGRIYLSTVMRASKDAGLVPEGVYDLWTGAIELRNTLVHNNGVADRTATYQFPDVTLQLQAGQMARDGLLFFAAVTDWVVNAFRDWCIAFLGP